MSTINLATSVDELALQVAAAAAPHAQRHDLEGTFAFEGIEAARNNGYLASAVPPELGGLGMRAAAIARTQGVIAKACGSTALACSMHLHVTLAAAWRYRRGDLVVEPMLRKVIDNQLVVVSTGGKDWTHPNTVATPVEGGWKVSGRKSFCSMAPIAGVASTFAVIGEPRPGAEVIVFGLPLTADGVTVEETWDAAGMRATGSHDIVLDDVFVAEAQITGRRTWGELDKPLLLASLHAWPIIYATYLGVADALVEAVLERRLSGGGTERLAGFIDGQQRMAHWALDGLLRDLGDDPDPTFDNFVAIQQMKRTVTMACLAIADAAAELGGGAHYAQRGPVDRMIRDIRAAIYHPYPPEATLELAGRARLAAV